MGREIERKFLVQGDGWRAGVVRSQHIRQFYLASTPHLGMRVRIWDDARAALTIKSAEKGLSRAEYEYVIPVSDAQELAALSRGGSVEKVRHDVAVGGLTWEVDVFAGRHAGLVLAEVELEHEEQAAPVPDWAGAEVTDDPRYFNENLAKG